MLPRGSVRVVAAILALTLAGGCMRPETAASPPVAAMPGTPGTAERVAEALVRADAAEVRQDRTALAQAATMLDRLGARGETAQDAARLDAWRASLPGDAPPMRGRALGPAFRAAVLDPGSATELNQTFLGGRAAHIVVRVARGPVPRLVVHDQANREVCKLSDHPGTCRWVPLYTQRHRIQIANTGRGVSKFFLVFD